MNHGGGRGRIEDRGRIINTNRTGPAAEKERLSVFDRLGTKRSTPSHGGGSGSHYSSAEYGLKEKSSISSTVVPVRKPPSERSSYNQSDMRYDQDKHSGYRRSRSRSLSSSPKYKTGLSSSVGSFPRKSHSSRKSTAIDQHHHQSKKAAKHEHRKPAKDKHKSNEATSSKVKKQRSKAKAKKASSTTDSSSHMSSKSDSESTSVSDVSSSSASESTSSESSVPSVKLKSGRKKRTSSVDASASKEKDKHSKELLSSSSSSQHEYKTGRSKVHGNSPHYMEVKSYSKDREYGKRGIPVKCHHYQHLRESDSVEHRDSHSKKYPNEGRKRKRSVDSYTSGGKRARHATRTPSPDQYGRHSHSRTPRRVSPDPGYSRRKYTPEMKHSPEMYPDSKSRRQRSPPDERIRLIRVPEKHPYREQDLRRDTRDDRYIELSRDKRERHYSPHYSSPSYEHKEKRPRERLAPARSSSPSRAREAPPQYDEPSIPRRAPLLSTPFPPSSNSIGDVQRYGFQGQHKSNSMGSRVGATQGRIPLIVKSKEALMQRYDEGRQSRVDLWVDETLSKEPGRPPLLPTPAYTPYRHPPAIQTETRPSPVKRAAPIGVPVLPPEQKKQNLFTEEKIAFKPETLQDELSDFSDDAEEILNEGIEESKSTQEETKKSAVEKSENVSVQASDSRDMRSNTGTGTHTEDDILERLDFEEISDDELGETEQKVTIVDVLGVDWASLINKPNISNEEETSANNTTEGKVKKMRLRDRLCPAARFRETGVPKALYGEEMFNKIYNSVQDFEERIGVAPEERTTREELEFPNLRRKRLAKSTFLENFDKMSSTSAFTAHQDAKLRRVLMDLPVGSAFDSEITKSIATDERIPVTIDEEENDNDALNRCIAMLQAVSS